MARTLGGFDKTSSVECKHSLLVTTHVDYHEFMASHVTTVARTKVQLVWQCWLCDDSNALTTASHVNSVRYRVNDIYL